jgi:hypothetical protein
MLLSLQRCVLLQQNFWLCTQQHHRTSISNVPCCCMFRAWRLGCLDWRSGAKEGQGLHAQEAGPCLFSCTECTPAYRLWLCGCLGLVHSRQAGAANTSIVLLRRVQLMQFGVVDGCVSLLLWPGVVWLILSSKVFASYCT